MKSPKYRGIEASKNTTQQQKLSSFENELKALDIKKTAEINNATHEFAGKLSQLKAQLENESSTQDKQAELSSYVQAYDTMLQGLRASGDISLTIAEDGSYVIHIPHDPSLEGKSISERFDESFEDIYDYYTEVQDEDGVLIFEPIILSESDIDHPRLVVAMDEVKTKPTLFKNYELDSRIMHWVNYIGTKVDGVKGLEPLDRIQYLENSKSFHDEISGCIGFFNGITGSNLTNEEISIVKKRVKKYFDNKYGTQEMLIEKISRMKNQLPSWTYMPLLALYPFNFSTLSNANKQNISLMAHSYITSLESTFYSDNPGGFKSYTDNAQSHFFANNKESQYNSYQVKRRLGHNGLLDSRNLVNEKEVSENEKNLSELLYNHLDNINSETDNTITLIDGKVQQKVHLKGKYIYYQTGVEGKLGTLALHGRTNGPGINYRFNLSFVDKNGNKPYLDAISKVLAKAYSMGLPIHTKVTSAEDRSKEQSRFLFYCDEQTSEWLLNEFNKHIERNTPVLEKYDNTGGFIVYPFGKTESISMRSSNEGDQVDTYKFAKQAGSWLKHQQLDNNVEEQNNHKNLSDIVEEQKSLSNEQFVSKCFDYYKKQEEYKWFQSIGLSTLIDNELELERKNKIDLLKHVDKNWTEEGINKSVINFRSISGTKETIEEKFNDNKSITKEVIFQYFNQARFEGSLENSDIVYQISKIISLSRKGYLNKENNKLLIQAMKSENNFIEYLSWMDKVNSADSFTKFLYSELNKIDKNKKILEQRKEVLLGLGYPLAWISQINLRNCNDKYLSKLQSLSHVIDKNPFYLKILQNEERSKYFVENISESDVSLVHALNGNFTHIYGYIFRKKIGGIFDSVNYRSVSTYVDQIQKINRRKTSIEDIMYYNKEGLLPLSIALHGKLGGEIEGIVSYCEILLQSNRNRENTLANFKNSNTDTILDTVFKELYIRGPEKISQFNFNWNEKHIQIIDKINQLGPIFSKEIFRDLTYQQRAELLEILESNSESALKSYIIKLVFTDLQKYRNRLKEINIELNDNDLRIFELYNEYSDHPIPGIRNIASYVFSNLYDQNSAVNETKIKSDFQKLEKIYIKNHLPEFYKRILVHNIVQGTDNYAGLSQMTKDINGYNQILIYKDLLKSVSKSNNLDLNIYLKNIASIKPLITKVENREPIEGENLTLLDNGLNSLLAIGNRRTGKNQVLDSKIVDKKIQQLKNIFNIESGSLVQGIERKVLGGVSVEEMITAIQSNIDETTKEHLNLIEGNKLIVPNSKLWVKGVKSQFFDASREYGRNSPEFIGSETEDATNYFKIDRTPYDVDGVEMDSNEGFGNITDRRYGDGIFLVSAIDERFTVTQNQKVPLDNKYELISRGDHSGYEFRGVRHSIGSSDIDFIVAKDEFISNSEKMNKIKFSIAKQGFYTPIVNNKSEVVFGIEEFNQLRKLFSGTDYASNENIEQIDMSREDSRYMNEINSMIEVGGKLSGTSKNVLELIKNNLEKLNINVADSRGDLNNTILNEMGSTARNTDIGGEPDFDYLLRLPVTEGNKIPDLANSIMKQYSYETSEGPREMGNGFYQIRLFKVDTEFGKIDIDIGIAVNNGFLETEPDIIISKKYNQILTNQGSEVLNKVKANIKWTKKVLKEHDCYKKGSYGQGGLGGLGVENRILNHDGNAIKAFKTFYNTAFNSGSMKEPIRFEEFKKNYSVLGVGVNARTGNSFEDFVEGNMTEKGYLKMAELTKQISSYDK